MSNDNRKIPPPNVPITKAMTIRLIGGPLDGTSSARVPNRLLEFELEEPSELDSPVFYTGAIYRMTDDKEAAMFESYIYRYFQ